MLKMFRPLIALSLFAALSIMALAPARALDLSLDGNLIGSCGTATASSGAATLNNKCGVITTEALTTAAGSLYTLTLTNSAIAAADIPQVSVSNGTNTKSAAQIMSVTPAAGSVVILLQNSPTGTGASGSTGAFNGTLVVRYFNTKP